MHRRISEKEYKELLSIVRSGIYIKEQRDKRVYIEYLGLSFLKYLYYADVASWRRGFPNQFKDCPMTRGQRSKAISFLVKRSLVYPSENRKRWFCKDKKELFQGISDLELEIKKRDGEETTS